MAKFTYKVAYPLILSAIFIITIFIALDYENMTPSFYIVIILVAVYVFFFGYATGERLASPVKELLERANRLSKGDLSDRIYLDTKDEIEELAKVYNRLAEELEESSNREKNTERSVDIKVRAKTKALEETINALEQKVNNRTIELDRLAKQLEKSQKKVIPGDTEKIETTQNVVEENPTPSKKIPSISDKNNLEE